MTAVLTDNQLLHEIVGLLLIIAVVGILILVALIDLYLLGREVRERIRPPP
jgi:uncharacterized membrane protein